MTNDDFIGRLESYLDEYEGVTPLPDAVRDAIRAELPHTKQTGSLGGRSRFLSMTLQLPTPARYGLVAAAVVVAAVIGASFLGRGGIGGPNSSPSPSPSASPSPTAAPTAASPWSFLDSPRTGDLPAGDYYLDIPAYPARIDVAVPEGWWYYWTGGPDRETSEVHAILVNNGIGDGHGSGWGLAFGIVDEVRVDPCHEAGGTMDPSVTQSADALATAFGTWTDFPATAEDVTIGGFSGKRVEITGAETATCEATFFTTPSDYSFGPLWPTTEPVVNQFIFLDVEGSVLVVWTTDYASSNEFEEDGGAPPDPDAHVADQVELHDILDSIVVTPR